MRPLALLRALRAAEAEALYLQDVVRGYADTILGRTLDGRSPASMLTVSAARTARARHARAVAHAARLRRLWRGRPPFGRARGPVLAVAAALLAPFAAYPFL